MDEACPREPVVKSPIHWPDRTWADAKEPAFQLVWDATKSLEVESGDLARHRSEVAAEVRIVICTVRGSQRWRGAFRHGDLLGRQQGCRGAIHLKPPVNAVVSTQAPDQPLDLCLSVASKICSRA